MATETQAQGAAAAEATTAEASILDQIIGATNPRDQEQKQRTNEFVQELVRQALATPGTKVISKTLVDTIKNWMGEIDRKLSEQINPILHHPDFQKLEGSWRGLMYLCENTQTSGTEVPIRIKVMNADKKTLFNDLDRAPTFDTSWLFKKIYTEGYGQLGADPFGMLVGDYEFTQEPVDVMLLGKISGVAAGAHAPFVAGASCKFFNFDSYTEMNNPTDLAQIFDSVDYAPWRSFRESEESRYVALALPKVMGRYPYSDNSPNKVEAFRFIEDVKSTQEHDKFLWMNAAWAYATRVTTAFFYDGWFMRTAGVESGGKIEGLPVVKFEEGGQKVMKCPSEVTIPDRRANEISNLGFLPVVHSHDSDWSVFMGVQTCQKAKKYFDPSANASAEMSTKLNYIMCVSRLSHYLYVMTRDWLFSMKDANRVQTKLNDWILNYVLAESMAKTASEDMMAKRPLRDAKVTVEDVPGSPGYYRSKIMLRPHYMFEKMDASISLVNEIKQGR